ncbi:MAG: DNA polymerase III subunit alpha [Bacteroidales bacterium]|nr:DNA polymerase III subunit alpha [Bacteroidales bacterium]MCB9013853.1 DNA polymerase III subunit alpha [Bacteroidales bacterium]
MYLNNHSYYSLRYGTMEIEKLIEKALENGVTAMALTDINNTMGMMDFVKLCLEKGIYPIAGIEFRNGDQYLYTGLARNNNGFRLMNEFLSLCNEKKEDLPLRAPRLEDVWFVYSWENKPGTLRENELIGIKAGDINKLHSSPLRYSQHKLIVWHPVSFAGISEYEIHRHLRAIDHNTLLSKLSPINLASEREIMVPFDLLLIAYEDYPGIIRNTENLVADCHISFDFQSIKNKKCFTSSRYDDKILLEKLAGEGMIYRYGKHNKEAQKRVKHELEIIDRLGFSAYFLITWDMIRYSMSRGYYHVGRGSGANSVVAYCLKITNVDPIELDLYFERFINPKRSSPPDFDIDYSWRERDDVLDYVFKRYGKKHTALIGTISTFRGRSIFRELGKVYGLPKDEIDRLVDEPGNPMNQNMITGEIFRIGSMIADFPNMRSIHAGGVLISEEPLCMYTALDMPPKGLPTTQWDMYVAEEIGFEKLDILSQRGIGHIHDAVEIIAANRGVDVDAHKVSDFKTDPQVLRQLRDGETNGCFYIESPAMRGLLKKLRCDNYISLVAASSIIRPGVARSGMMKEYIRRFHNPEGFEYLHPVMKEQLSETYGVMVYQEDVIKVCHHFAGLDLADADVLRRAMSGKFRSGKEFERIAQRFHDNCRERGYPDEITNEVWRQISSFAGYSFSKAHSASYAVESFQSLYLKAHFPLEFMVAVINNFGGFYRSWVYINEARRCGANILLPCVNNSEHLTCIKDRDIYLGFVHIQNLEERLILSIVSEREQNGPYRELADFTKRVKIGKEQIVILIRTDAFRFTGKTKKQLLWEAHMLLGVSKTTTPGEVLFESKPKKFVLPDLEQSIIEDAYDEIELLGFPVSLNRFDMLQTGFRGEIRARDMMKHLGKRVRMVGNLVSLKNVITIKKEWMHFGAFLDPDGEFFDVVNFPDTLKKYPYKGYGVYLILGKIVEEFGFPSIEVEKMAKLGVIADPRY